MQIGQPIRQLAAPAHGPVALANDQEQMGADAAALVEEHCRPGGGGRRAGCARRIDDSGAETVGVLD